MLRDIHVFFYQMVLQSLYFCPWNSYPSKAFCKYTFFYKLERKSSDFSYFYVQIPPQCSEILMFYFYQKALQCLYFGPWNSYPSKAFCKYTFFYKLERKSSDFLYFYVLLNAQRYSCFFIKWCFKVYIFVREIAILAKHSANTLFSTNLKENLQTFHTFTCRFLLNAQRYSHFPSYPWWQKGDGILLAWLTLSSTFFNKRKKITKMGRGALF